MDKTEQTVDPSQIGDLSVYEPNRIDLAPGDWIRVTRNLKIHDLANGERYQIKSITSKSLTLSNGTVLDTAERLHLQYGYVTTVHSAQGLTEDRVLIDANTKSLTSNKAVYYVAISRPRYELKIYTDNKKKLPESMSRTPKKFAAMDIRTIKSDRDVVQQNIANRLAKRMAKRATQNAHRVERTSKILPPRLQAKAKSL